METAASIDTSTPTLTLTPSPTLPPTLSPTETPFPTPVGGGTGSVIFAVNPFSDQSPSDADGIYTIQSDSTGVKQVLSMSQWETMTGEEFEYLDVRLNSGQYYIATNTLYALTNDWKLDHKIDLPKYLLLEGFSTDSQHVLYYQSDASLYAASLDGSELIKLLDGSEYFTGTSADSSRVYFFSGLDVYQKAVNMDGSDKRNIPLTSLKDYVPYEGIKTPFSSTRTVYTRIFDSYGVSPDRQQVAFTWWDLVFVTTASDTEFEAVQLVARLLGSDTTAEVRAATLKWSPDQEGLALLVTRSNKSKYYFGSEVIYVDLTSGEIKSIVSSEESNYVLCGFSPDSTQISILFQDETAHKGAIQLVQVGQWTRLNLVELDRSIGCPVWQDAVASD